MTPAAKPAGRGSEQPDMVRPGEFRRIWHEIDGWIVSSCADGSLTVKPSWSDDYRPGLLGRMALATDVEDLLTYAITKRRRGSPS